MSTVTDTVLVFIKKNYGVEPEYLWQNEDTAAIRHRDTKKWFGALIKNLPKAKLGLPTEERSNVLNLKCDPQLNYSVVDNIGIFPGWHMNKEHWISVLLDGTVVAEEIFPLIRMSYALTSRTKAKR